MKENIATIFLLGFQCPNPVNVLLFLLICMTYCVTICGNLLVIFLVSYSRNLHSPMYFFLTQLTTSDILTTSNIVPKMLHVILNNGSYISLPGCFAQFFSFSYPESAECLLLTVMSYDRYLAICKPLSYHSIMTSTLCLKTILTLWMSSIFAASAVIVSISQLSFCRSGVIDHFFCDFEPILELSCSETFIVWMFATSVAFHFVIVPFVLILISYICILHTILKMQSISQKEKAFSTCGSHLAVVSIFYGTLCITYLAPAKGKSNVAHKILSLIYSVVIPLINPIIYCLRNRGIKVALRKLTEW